MTAPGETASRGLVRSLLVIGSAQAVNIAMSIGRMKLVALMLGPAGVGILSILTSFKEMGTQVAGLGMASSGVRDIAMASRDDAALSRVRRVLFVSHLVQGGLAMLAVWLFREPLAAWLFGDTARATEVGLLGLVILFGLIGSAQTTLLQGLRRVGDLGRVTVLGALAATIAGLAAVWSAGEAGLIWFLLVQPLAGIFVAIWYIRRLPHPAATALTARDFWHSWQAMVRLGLAFMLGGLINAATLLLVRTWISQDLGLEAAGHFAAAWSITMLYIGFLLNAMGSDYYPRLAEVIHDRKATVSLINDQMQLGLAVGGPFLLLLIGWAPWVIPALYSDQFGPAIALVQLQTVGNLLKIASWPMGFTNVAAGRSKTFLFFQVNFNVIFLGISWLALGEFGIIVTGPAFVLGYLTGFMLGFIVVRTYHGFAFEKLSLGLVGLHMISATGVLVLSQFAPLVTAAVAPLLALATGIVGLRVVLIKVGPSGRVASRLASLYARIGWPIRSAEQ